MHPLAGIALTATSGALYALAFPPLSWQPFAFVALVPFLVALRRLALGPALLCAFLWAWFASFFVANALPHAVETYFLQPRWLSWAFALFIWAITGSVYYMAFAAVLRGFRGLPGPAWPLLVAAAWAALELGRGRLLTGTEFFIGNPWALIGYSQVGFDAFLQVASLGGIYAVGFAVVAFNAGLAEAWLRRRDGRAAGARLVLIGAVPAVLTLAYGALVLRDARDPDASAFTAVVAQGHLDLGAQWKPEFYGQNLDAYLHATLKVIDRVGADVVFWPESALTFHLEDEPLYRLTIARVLAEAGAQLIVGGPATAPSTEGEEVTYTNSVFLVDEAGSVLARYDKRYLVPFAEYTPLRSVDLMRRNFGRVRVFEPGGPTPLFDTDAGRAGVIVCNEAILPEVAAERVRAGAQILVNPSNDSWIAERNWASLMADMSSVRAIETRRYLVRASTSGPSAVVDPWGRIQIDTEPMVRAAIAGRIQPRDDVTLYTRLGDAFAFACLAVSVAAAAFAMTRRRRDPDFAARPL